VFPPDIPPAARAALGLLTARDPDLARIEEMAGPLAWRTRPVGFPGLLQAIMGQQISNQAAAAIWRRLAAIPGALDPATMPAIPDEALRAAGLSRGKILSARALAEAFADGRLATEHLATMGDEEAVAAISAVRGLGRWTAEVYLAGDVALQASAAALKGLPARPGPVALRAMAAAWQPHRSLAARLLWHHWRFLTGRPSMDDVLVLPG
jgi:DNA-3-methyladenine glycosylase II